MSSDFPFMGNLYAGGNGECSSISDSEMDRLDSLQRKGLGNVTVGLSITDEEKRKPLFEYLLFRRTDKDFNKVFGVNLPFFEKADKTIIDADEFAHWQSEHRLEMDRRDTIVNGLKKLGNKIVWIELFHMPTFTQSAIHGPSYKLVGPIRGVGIDGTTGKIYMANIDPESGYVMVDVFTALKEMENPDRFDRMMIALNVYGLMDRYLKGEDVKAEAKQSGKLLLPRAKSNKKRKKTLPYRVSFLKKPLEQKKKPREPHEVNANREYDHRWEVRGHWRNIRGFGHDQTGNVIFGKTWVKECVKGPDDKPLIKKATIALNKLPKGYEEVRA